MVERQGWQLNIFGYRNFRHDKNGCKSGGGMAQPSRESIIEDWICWGQQLLKLYGKNLEIKKGVVPLIELR